MKINDLFESPQQCPECGGPAFGDLLLAEKKDACYSKVRSRYKVWPSAYASGALVQCRKKGAANWGNNSKNEDVAEGSDTAEDYRAKAQWLRSELHLSPDEAWERAYDTDPETWVGSPWEDDYKQGMAEGNEATPFGSVNDQRPQMPVAPPQDREAQEQAQERQARINNFREKKQDLLQQFAQLGTLRTEMIHGLDNDVFLNKDQLIDFFKQQIDDPSLTALEYAYENGIPTDGLIKNVLRRATQLGVSMLDVRKMFSQAKQKLGENIGRKVDAKGLTQGEWMQAVKQKFPDAKIVQAKMIDGPAHALLSDGRKIVWNPVQGMAEAGFTKTPSGDYINQHTGVRSSKPPVKKKRGEKTGAEWDAIEKAKKDKEQGVTEVGQNFRRGNARRAALNAMSPEELKAHEEKRAEQQRKRDEARLERERQRNAAKKGVAEDREEYRDEAGMARTNLITIARAADGLLDTIDQYEDLPEWVQEKIAKVEQMLVVAWDYLKSQEAQGIDPRITEMYQGLAEDWQRVSHRAELDREFQLIESIVHRIADSNGVDAETVWEDLDSLSNDELYVFAVTSEPINEDWQKANKRDRTAGMSRKAVNAYRRENPGSKLQTAVTTKPSKLKRGSKASKRRKSYCSRSRGQMKMHNISCAKTPDKAICKARRRWNC